MTELDETPIVLSRAYDKVPPHSVESEMCLLASMMLDKEIIPDVMELVNDRSFYQEDHQIIFRILVRLYESGRAADSVILSEELERRQILEEVGGRAYLGQILNSVPSSAHAKHYATAVKEKAILRSLIALGNCAVSAAYSPYQNASDIERIIGEVSGLLTEIETGVQSEQVRKLWQICEHVYGIRNQLKALRLSTHIPSLDSIIGGIPLGGNTLIASRPGMGKSMLAKQLALNIAKSGDPVGIISIEETGEKIAINALSAESGVVNSRIAFGKASDDEWNKIALATCALEDTPVWIVDSAYEINRIAIMARALVRKHKCRAIIVDHLHLIEAQSNRNENRESEVRKISGALKMLWKRLGVAGITCAQLNRSKGRERPSLESLRDSGCLAGDTRITLSDGSLVPIGELRAPFEVHSLNPETLKLERATATKVFSTGIKPVFEMMMRMGRTIKATSNHRFFTMDGWKRVDELKAGDHIGSPRFTATGNGGSVTKPEAALLGHLIGDGCTLPNQPIHYTTAEIDVAETVFAIARECFGNSIRPRISRERTWYQVYLPPTEHMTWGRRNPIGAWLDRLGVFGLRSYEKRVPDCLFSEKKETIAAFLAHLWVTDGCVSPGGKPTVYLATSSRRLAEGVQHLLLIFSITARISRVPQVGKGRLQYHIIVSGQQDIASFAKDIGVGCERKRKQLDALAATMKLQTANTNRDLIPRSAWNSRVRPAMASCGISWRELHAAQGTAYNGTAITKNGIGRLRLARIAKILESPELDCLASADLYWDSIKSISACGEEETFDITVPGNHNFIANDIVAHNSLEQDGDIVLMLHREDYYRQQDAQQNGDNPEYDDVLEVIVAKNKDGCTGTVPLHCEIARQTIVDPTGEIA